MLKSISMVIASIVLLLSMGSARAASGGHEKTATGHELGRTEAALRAHVAYLASDELRGRQPGTDGYDKAASYVAQQMKAIGIRPAAADGTYYQKVPLVATRSSGLPQMTVNDQPLLLNTDFGPWPTPGLQGVDVEAAVVFAGYGVVDPVSGRDDYRDLDVRGKVVALFMSGPRGVNSEVAAHLAFHLDRARLAKAHGAVGVIYLYTKQLEPLLPFDFFAPILASHQTTWSDSNDPRDLGAPRLGVLNTSGADKLFSTFGTSWQTIRAAEDAGKAVPLGALKVRLKTTQKYETTPLSSANVIGRLPGSDARLASQTIILSAHLDHVGTIAPVNGDDIANGALDNAIGVALMLEAARSFQSNGDKPKRSILFVALTAEESGLTGSDYFTQHPVVPAASIVANINNDCPILTYPFQDVVVLGGERSSIGRVAKEVIGSQGLQLTPDPMPEQAYFTRSDQYNFVRLGVPSIFIQPGPKGPGLEAAKEYFSTRYHTPADDMSIAIDWAAGRKFTKINYLIAKKLADTPDRPRWVKGDYFGTFYKGPMASQ